MNFPENPPSSETGAVLREALDRRTPLVMSFRDDEGWLTFKTRVLHVDHVGARFDVEPPAENAARLREGLPEGSYVGVAFRRGHRKCLCTCVVDKQGFEADHKASRAIRLCWPKQIQALQRRNYYRVPVPANRELRALVWPGGVDARPDHPGQDRSNVYVHIVDISLGGMAVRLPALEACPFTEGQTVGCEFGAPDGGRITVEAQFRHLTRKPGGEQLLGLQFVGLEHGESGRRCIRQLVALTQHLSRGSRPPSRRVLSRSRPSV